MATPTGLCRQEGRNPFGVGLLPNSYPRVAAQRGNPGLSYITTSRYKPKLRLDQTFPMYVLPNKPQTKV